MSNPHNVLLDTSAIIDLERLDEQRIADSLGCQPGDLRPAISSISMAELAAGPHAAKTADARAVRQAVLQWAESAFAPIPFDTDAARSYGIIYALVLDLGRQPRKRLADLLIASVAAANSLPLVTRNPDDFAGLESQIQVIVA
ncbi:type II toxin-antitoxin system VapC family toxin [Streptosporangium sp. NBC_01639]|uniref:type II toxin-antitoxin system VapC family toxin n=1 Tax=Streptosporangium sp. NBC_01639 TaxID=2975948 RepID=UPI00386489B6|nr:type II toxin-antitoxin system VapC family toxin [Streptosporangium sp. NBC_01639]